MYIIYKKCYRTMIYVYMEYIVPYVQVLWKNWVWYFSTISYLLTHYSRMFYIAGQVHNGTPQCTVARKILTLKCTMIVWYSTVCHERRFGPKRIFPLLSHKKLWNVLYHIDLSFHLFFSKIQKRLAKHKRLSIRFYFLLIVDVILFFSK